MKKPIITIAENPEYRNPRAPLIWIDIPLAAKPVEPGVISKDAAVVHHMPIAVSKRGEYVSDETHAKILVWAPAQVFLPRLRVDMSDAGQDAISDFTATVSEAMRIARGLDRAFPFGSPVGPNELKAQDLFSIVGDPELNVESAEFVTGEIPKGKFSSPCEACRMCNA